jgi:hypothetical protein
MSSLDLVVPWKWPRTNLPSYLPTDSSWPCSHLIQCCTGFNLCSWNGLVKCPMIHSAQSRTCLVSTKWIKWKRSGEVISVSRQTPNFIPQASWSVSAGSVLRWQLCSELNFGSYRFIVISNRFLFLKKRLVWQKLGNELPETSGLIKDLF